MSLKHLLTPAMPKALVSSTFGVLAIILVQATHPTLVLAQGLPTGGHTTHGQATIQSIGSGMQINQTTPNAVINWNSFNIDTGNGVSFQVPAGGTTLNQIAGWGSKINGNLTSNGALFLVNPNGVRFGNGANVNVGSLVVTTSGMNPDNFMNRNYSFTAVKNPGYIRNDGVILTESGGYVVLAGGGAVVNTGTIFAPNGAIHLASAETFTLTLSTHNPFLNLTVDAAANGLTVDNAGALKSGAVNLQAVGSVTSGGFVEASSLDDLKGSITFISGANVNVDGIVNSQGEIKLSSKRNTRITHANLAAEKNIEMTSGGALTVVGSTMATANGSISLDSDARLSVHSSSLEANSGNIDLKGVSHGPQINGQQAGVLIVASALTATSPDPEKGKINVTARTLAGSDTSSFGAQLKGAALTANSINIDGQGQTAVSLDGGNTLRAKQISLKGSADSFGSGSVGLSLSGNNQLTAEDTLNLTGTGASGVLFNGNTSLNSPQTVVSSN